MDISEIINYPLKYNDFLINKTNTINFNQTTIKNHINEIFIKLLNIDEKKEETKYLTLSCILGAFLGDSMGSVCEFSEKSPFNHNIIFKIENGIFEKGEITDDSEMAISAAFAYMDLPFKESIKIKDLLFFYFCIWKNSRPKDIGKATQTALSLFVPDQDSILSTKFTELIQNYIFDLNKDSLANGFLMRISTFIVFFYYAYFDFINEILNPNDTSLYLELYNKIYQESYKNVVITHPNIENVIVSAIFTFMVLIAFVKKKAKDVLTHLKILINHKYFISQHKEKDIAEKTVNKINNVIKDIDKNYNIDVYSHMGYYLHSIKLSIYFLKKYERMENCELYEDGSGNQNLYRQIMEEICDFGGDTDTNCAIVGTLIGPLIGYKNFDRDLFTIFIKFFPKKRIQYTSAFMYEYVDFLENKYLNINNNKNQIIKNDNDNNNNKNEDIKNNNNNNQDIKIENDNNNKNINNNKNEDIKIKNKDNNIEFDDKDEKIIKKDNNFIVLQKLMKFLS